MFSGSDVGKLKYFIQRDGRAYNLQCADGNSITLTFNKKVSVIIYNITVMHSM